MDMISCVARRTRSRTETYLNFLLRRSKGIVDDPVEGPSKEAKKRTNEKKRDSIRNCSSPPLAKRRGGRPRRSTGKNDGVTFVGTNFSNRRRQCVNVDEEDSGFASKSSLGFESKSVECDSVSAFSNGEVNLSDDDVFCPNEIEKLRKGRSGKERTYALSGSIEVEGNSSANVAINLDSDEDVSVEELEVDVGQHGGDTDSHDSDDETADSKTSDCMSKSSDSSYEDDSEESEHLCSGDERAETVSKNNVESKKCLRKKVRERGTRKEFPSRKNLDVFNLLANSIREKDNLLEDIGDSCDEQGTYYCTADDLTPLNLNFGYEEPKPVEKSEEEKELDELWDEMALALTANDIHSTTTSKNEDEEMDEANPVIRCSQGKHDLILDEEVGLKCYYCSHVAIEIRDISPAMDRYPTYCSDRKRCSGEKEGSMFNGLEFQVSDGKDSLAPLNGSRGTVWDCIPGIKGTLYPHQEEGFEFIWKNLAGTINLEHLKSLETTVNGGCIISHSPGTGKTRLTIVFLMAYLEVFPESHPVVIAPASLLLTWEEEFSKWNVNIPFYNMNSLELSGKESSLALSILKRNRRHSHNKNSIRMVKLFSWCKKKSILGVSYNLYEKLAGGKSSDKAPKNRTGPKLDREREELRKILREMPDLLVLDEGHTPRNQRSCIWKALSQAQTKKRILLSGTPFQNNFRELSNILCLTRPANADAISSRLKTLCKWSNKSKNGKVEVGIKELRALMAPFVHVHKGSILQKSLPGLRDCVVVLNPQDLQKKILVRIDRKQNIFELEHKLSAVSVHPSLFLGCSTTKKEGYIIGPSMLESLERIKLNSKEGAKTRFLVEFIRFSESMNEKVLVFSQYLDTLSLIMEQLNSLFGWIEGKEVFYMHGKLDQRQRQSMINNFNEPNCEAKVFLASTRACSEGINLVGASRVVLLDVVWNPSVERQAISRAYRLGQKRVVYTYHLVIKDTPECDKYCKQAAKDRISELVFSSANEKDKLKSLGVVSEDKILEEMIWHDKLKDMFEKIIYQPKESDLVESFASVTL